MLNDPRSHGLWERTAPPAPDTPALAGSVHADVVVVGAGFTGLSAALHLAEEGARVVVLDRTAVGFGGSGRNAGLVNAGLWVMPDEVPSLLGPERGERLLALLGEGPRTVFDLVTKHAIACEPVRAGTLHCGVGARGAAEVAERAAQWRKRGADVELLTADQTAQLVGTNVYSAALLDRRAGTIQPLAYVRGLARAALAAGATIHTESGVERFEREGSGWQVVTKSGTVTADWIVVATNAYTTAPWPEIRSEIVHLPYFNIATAPLGGNVRRSILPERQGVWDTKEVLSSYRFDQAGRLIVGSVGALRGTGTAVHRRWAKRTLRHLFPQLGAVRFESEWYGTIGMTDDALPRFHRLAPNVVSFSGYNGRGIAPGTVFGRTLAQLIAGRVDEDSLPLPETRPGTPPFRALREAYYEYGAQIAHLSARI